jgi:hypothetical protein
VNSSKLFSYYFRKSPLFRTLFEILVIVGILTVAALIGIKIRHVPAITNINPPVGSPGDLVIIRGKNFGNSRDMSYVEVGGSHLTASSYLAWSDTEIKVILPANVKDGLVIVGTNSARSKPAFFANEREIPGSVPQNLQTSMPAISGVSINGAVSGLLSVKPGDLIVITGSNFGNTYDDSSIFFSSARENKINASPVFTSNNYSEQGTLQVNIIPASRSDYDYAYWSDTEIRVYVPDGAADGMLYVETPKGKSTSQRISVSSPIGTKKFLSHHTYLLQLSADIADAVSEKNSTITLRVPRPQTSASQPIVEMTECSPDPVIADYQHTIIHQIQTSKILPGKKQFRENFVISVYEVDTTINPDRAGSYNNMNKILYSATTRNDHCVPSTNGNIVNLAQQIVKKEKNPYKIAQLIYDYLLDNYRLLQTVRAGNISPLDLLNKKSGDSYDFAIIYTALLRATGIPALPDGGILVDRDMKVRDHWWTEFYLAGFGWVPVDPALGAGLNYKRWTEIENPRKFYFGNLDSQHILFSHGWNAIKPGSPNSKIVQRPRSYALQSIWEESSASTIRYSSFWNTPAVLGVY